jgi:hypothetical protein
MSNGLFQTLIVGLLFVSALVYLAYHVYKAMQHKKDHSQGCDNCK